MINTIIPWIIIFGVMNIDLIIFPGWVSPFANTFGYGAMNLLGLKDLLKVILNLDKDNPDIMLAGGVGGGVGILCPDLELDFFFVRPGSDLRLFLVPLLILPEGTEIDLDIPLLDIYI